MTQKLYYIEYMCKAIVRNNIETTVKPNFNCQYHFPSSLISWQIWLMYTQYVHSVLVQNFASGRACCVNQYHYESLQDISMLVFGLTRPQNEPKIYIALRKFSMKGRMVMYPNLSF